MRVQNAKVEERFALNDDEIRQRFAPNVVGARIDADS